MDRQFGRPADDEGYRDVVIVIASQRVARTRVPDDRLREAIHAVRAGSMDCFVASLLAMTGE
jgi:hypothetical protein